MSMNTSMNVDMSTSIGSENALMSTTPSLGAEAGHEQAREGEGEGRRVPEIAVALAQGTSVADGASASVSRGGQVAPGGGVDDRNDVDTSRAGSLQTQLPSLELEGATTSAPEKAKVTEKDEEEKEREQEEQRPQAGPLPTKRGEIGFQERYLKQLADEEEEEEEDDASGDIRTGTLLPERHPADRDAPAPAQATQAASSSSSNTNANASTSTNSAEGPLSQPGGAEATAQAQAQSKRFASKAIPSLGGVHLSTLLLLILQLVLVAATIACWVVAGVRLSAAGKSSNTNTNTTNNTNTNTNTNTNSTEPATATTSNNGPFTGASSQIFVHVLFVIALLMQLVFLERRIYRVRAERYVFAHPGLPLFSRSGSSAGADGMGIGFAPWNRPPLPTYAAVLAQSGVGTGDVEDSAIAIAPPPAYGQTRGSTLLLAGVISDTLRAQRRRERAERGSRASRASSGSGSRGSVVSLESLSERPVSYASRDEEWEERRDAMRAARVEETLAKLEEARFRTSDGVVRR